MKVIVREKFEESKVQLNDTSFIRSLVPVKITSKSPILSFMDAQKWSLTGFRVFIDLIGTIIISY